MSSWWPWMILFGLGAYHGINPAMGWLFAVALGLQEGSRRGVLRAVPPIALGHTLSILGVACLVWLARTRLPEQPVRYGAAAVLFAFALYRLVRSRHPTWVGMRVGFGDLTLWSFLMASAHGAGLMLAPVLFLWPSGTHPDPPVHAAHTVAHLAPMANHPLPWFAAVVVHAIGYLALVLLTALVVYEKVGVAFLRRAWFNLDRIWFAALMVCGLTILVV
jgi:hypothetical protein